MFLLGLGAACTGEAPRQSPPEPPASPPAPLEYLFQYVGRDPAAAGLWDTEPLRSRMTRLLGGDYALFRDHLAVTAPLRAERGLLLVTGTCAAGQAAWGAALLVADPRADRLLLKLRTDRDTATRSRAEGEITALPAEVMKELRSWDERPVPPRPASKERPKETKG